MILKCNANIYFNNTFMIMFCILHFLASFIVLNIFLKTQGMNCIQLILRYQILLYSGECHSLKILKVAFGDQPVGRQQAVECFPI